MAEATTSNRPVFNALSADDAENQLTEIESLCMNCYAQGTTRLLLTKIPYYKDIILSSFECDSCHFKNNDIQPAQRTEAYGILITVQLTESKDLDRQIVKSAFGTLRIKELDFEQAPVGENGLLTTIEGFLTSVVENISKTIKQIEETIATPTEDITEQTVAEFQQQKEKLRQFIERVEALKSFAEPFHFEIDDPSGNSFIENPNAPYRDERMTIKKYRRTAEQNEKLGILNDEDDEDFEDQVDPNQIKKDEILNFGTNCPNCNAPCETHMKLTEIPYFKEVIIMATSCDACGHKSNEVKSGTGIAEKGIRYELKMTDASDLNRDILISETSLFAIPDLDFENSSSRSIGGRFSTIEGVITTLKDRLASVLMPFSGGDSNDAKADSNRMSTFIKQLDAILAGEQFVTIVIDDPAGSCYLQNVYAPEPDPNMIVEHYERSEEQNELLGLNDMCVENYEAS